MISEHLNKRIHVVLTTILSFCIPFFPQAMSLLIVLLTLNWIINFSNVVFSFKNIIQNKGLAAMIIFYLLYVLGLLYTSNLKFAGEILEIKLSFLVVPLVYIAYSKETIIQFNHYLKCFIYGCVAYALYCFGYATYAYFKPVYTDLYGVLYNLGSNYFYYSYLSSVIHPSYTAMYTIVALLAIRYLYQQKNIYLNYTWLSIIVFLTTYVFFLSSKAGWIGLGFTYFIFLFDLIKSGSYFKLIFISLILIGFFFLINVYFAPQYASRIPKMQSIENAIKGKDKNNKPSTTGTDGSGSRIFVWKASLEVIKENLPLGAGTGDSRDKLMEKYLEKKMDTEYKFGLNSHNQFLNTSVSLGILGFLSLIICFWIPFHIGLKLHELFLINFVIILTINLLFESMFERQSGIIFYVFFNTLLCSKFTQSKSS